MPLTLDNNDAQFQIRAYKPGRIQVNEKIYTRSLIIAPQQIISDWIPQTILELKREHFTDIMKQHPAILLIGTGQVLQFPPLEAYGELLNQGIGVEIMNTQSACHTYNILTAEGRDVVAALILS